MNKLKGGQTRGLCYFSCLLHKVVIHQQIKTLFEAKLQVEILMVLIFSNGLGGQPRGFGPTIFDKVHPIPHLT
jgi:hypothetical protein